MEKQHKLTTVTGSTKVINVKENHRLSMLVRLSTKILEKEDAKQ